MKSILFKIVIAALVATVYAGCKKPKTYPDIPSIEFMSLGTAKNVVGNDSISVIAVSFTDGDGDVGYMPAGNGNPYDDKSSIYYNNFIVSLF